MSGGVDSAVTLLRVRAAGYEPVGATLRLWLDPHGPDAERACCSPEAVLAARATCHGLGVPHVTLDLREEFRRAVVAPFVDGLRARGDPEPVHALQRSFRFAELLEFAERVGAPGSRPATTRVSPSTAAACSSRGPRMTGRRTSPTCSRSSTRSCSAGSGSRWASPRRRRCAPRRSRRSRRSHAGREPGGVLPRGRRLPGLPRRRTASPRTRAPWWTRTAARSAAMTATGASRRASGAASASRRARRCSLCGPTPRRTPSSSARTRLARPRTVAARDGRLYVPVTRADAKLRYRSPVAPASVTASGDGFDLLLDAPAYGVAPGPGRSPLRGRRGRRRRAVSSAE